MRIHVTRKLAEKLSKAGHSIANSSEEPASKLGDWHANITTIQRRQCVVFTHDETRFTMVLLGVTLKELKGLQYWFEDMLANCMLKLGYDHELIQKAGDSVADLSFDTDCSRSVQGTLRVMIGDLEARTWDGASIMDLAPYSLSASLNDRPCTVKGMKGTGCLWPRQAMQERLEQLVKLDT